MSEKFFWAPDPTEHQGRIGDQSDDRESARPYCAARVARARRQGDRMRGSLLQCSYVFIGSCVTSAVGTTVRNCTGDEGRPFEVGNQVLVSSHRKLLSSKAMVVSIAEKPGQDFGRHG